MCVVSCVVTRRFGACCERFYRISFGFHPHWLYRSNMRRLTCPAIAMIVESDVPFSASWVMAQCRRSWNRKPGKPAFLVSVLHADRQLFRCRVGSKAVTL